jgi:N-acetylglucosaminyldiphosphoundecaprenol N-acetyl-beta-D-mannosaminyltransferase
VASARPKLESNEIAYTDIHTPEAPLYLSRVNVLGVGIHALDMPSSVRVIDSAVRNDNRGYVCVTGVHGVMEAQKDLNLKKIINNALLVTADGIPMVWVGRLQRYSQIKRVYGPDLMLEVCRMSVDRGYSHFIYGGEVAVADELAARLSEMFPGIKISGTFSPPFRPLNILEELELVEIVKGLKPDIFWVGLSTPKQERFMAAYIDKLDTKVMLGVGAAFDIHTGRVNDAPEWVKRIGMQWLHRLLQEPRRLAKRYLINNPKFIYRISLQLLCLRKYSLEIN